MEYRGRTNEFFEVAESLNSISCKLEERTHPAIALLWFKSDGNELIIDGKPYTFNNNEIICLTEFHQVEVIKSGKLRSLRWNKEFYCILNHDSEVGCKGILFYGALKLPVISLCGEDLETLEIVWQMLLKEMVSNDNLQEEMLRMMLKRMLILCARIYKNQEDFTKLSPSNVDIVREYNFLVEVHFKEKHTVNEYAELLHKSPKTLANLFKKLGDKTPLQYIKDRKMLEARRLLKYTKKTVSETGYELGFSDVQSFSRFFKKEEGISPSHFITLAVKEK